LPVTTPEAPSSPSAASLASAPRSLKDPVRWRFSALSATAGAPQRRAIVRDESTGVWRTSSPAARRTRAMASSGSSFPRRAADAMPPLLLVRGGDARLPAQLAGAQDDLLALLVQQLPDEPARVEERVGDRAAG